MVIKFYNTLTRKKEEFKPIKQGEVRMYSCGPTVYDYVHIGNLRAFVVSDLIARYLRFKGYKVIKVMNITDVDDKTIAAAQCKGIPLSKYTEHYTRAFFEDLNTLNIVPADYYPKATEHISDMVALIKRIKAKGHTYELNGSTYFRIASFPNYGKLAHLDFNKLIANAQGRFDSDEYDKENARDFVLWKAWKPSDCNVFWETELGKGRPGWHIECSAMSMRYLGESFDIHTGGVDLIFPHHTNEIAQSESATGKQFVRYWLHNEYLFVNGQKMSKSLGNFYKLRELIDKGFKPEAIRYTLLATNYRMPLNFTFESVKASERAVERLNNFIAELYTAEQGKQHGEIPALIKRTEKGFEAAMDDNLNISKALGILFDFLKAIYKIGFSSQDAEQLLGFLKKIDMVLGVMDFTEPVGILTADIENLIVERNEARAKRDWARADAIRNKLKARGIELIDTPHGTKWRRITKNDHS